MPFLVIKYICIIEKINHRKIKKIKYTYTHTKVSDESQLLGFNTAWQLRAQILLPQLESHLS